MKTLFILNGPSGNRGCEAILISTYDLMRQAFPDSSFVNAPLRGNRDKTLEYLQLPRMEHRPHADKGVNLPFIRWLFAKHMLGHRWFFERFLSEADIVMSLGGDNYSLDYNAVQWHLLANDRVVRAGKKLVIWGASVGPFTADPEAEKWAARSMKQCHAVILRENLSRDYLASLGVTDNVHVMPDPAFSLTPDPVTLSAEVEALLDDGAIGFNVSPLLARYRADPDAWLAEASNWLVALARQTEAPILLIPHVMYGGNDDHDFLNRMLAQAELGNARSRVKLIDARDWSSRNLKFVIGRLRAFIGARTHATIAAMSQGVPTLSIGYSVKARGINIEVFGSDKWVVDHKTLTADTLAGHLAELLAVEDEVRAQLAEKNTTYKIDPQAIAAILGNGLRH